MPRARLFAAILDGRPEPDMRRRQSVRIAGVDVVAEARAALRQNLECVPGRYFHRLEDTVDEAERDFLVKKVAHRIDEDHLRFAPPQRLFQPFGTELKVEPVFEGMSRDAAEPFGESPIIAVVAASTFLRATGYRAPRRIIPF